MSRVIENNPNLIGSVAAWQNILNGCGYNPQLTITGVLDAATKTITLRFQRDVRLPQTGRVDLATWRAGLRHTKSPRWSPVTPPISSKPQKVITQEEYFTQVRVRNLPQPNNYTCQSTCISMVIGGDIMAIRAQLERIGPPGDPATMGQVLRKFLGNRYLFDEDASLVEIRDWLRAGEFLITHGWFTTSGHVIGLDGVALDPNSFSYKISVKDPWSEFNFATWAYDKSNVNFYDGYYSSYGLYAAIVAGRSVEHARQVYARGELDSQKKGAWVHRIKSA